MTTAKKTYFLSDAHLGIDMEISSRDRERMLVNWMEQHRDDMRALYLVGDIFDYWYEYREVVPRGYVRLLGKLAELTDQGIEIHFFKGNHDMWMYDYFQSELGIIVHDETLYCEIDGRKFFIAHGDQVGPHDRSYRITRGILRSSIAQWMFSTLHPSIGLGLMRWFSGLSRDDHYDIAKNRKYTNGLIRYLDEGHLGAPFDYFICGHMHDPTVSELSEHGGTYCNLGDWMYQFTYAVWDGEELRLERLRQS